MNNKYMTYTVENIDLEFFTT